MAASLYIPDSIDCAELELISTLIKPLDSLPKDEFIRAWSSLAYLFPQLHPDSWDEPDGGWPASLVPLATEAWRRIEAGELDGDEVYPSDAQWCGLYDQMSEHTPDELEHRRKLALLCRGSIDG